VIEEVVWLFAGAEADRERCRDGSATMPLAVLHLDRERYVNARKAAAPGLHHNAIIVSNVRSSEFEPV